MRRNSIPRNILMLGLVSFFTDFGTEMVYPLIPLYLASSFGATPLIIGLIEGVVESVAALLKVAGGYLGDKFRRKKAIAFAGYSTALIYKAVLLLAGSWGAVFGARLVDRIGKGIRTAPRDSLVAESSKAEHLGSSFGFHKMMDMGGSALGILASLLILRHAGDMAETPYRAIFLISCIPAVLALTMFLFIREGEPQSAHAPQKANTGSFRDGIRSLDRRLLMYLAVTFFFTLGNSSNSFLVLKASQSGIEPGSALVLYFIYSITSSLLAMPAGKLSDRIGRKGVLVSALIIFAMAYLVFAWASGWTAFICAFAMYGLHTAVISGAERAFIAEISPPHMKGTMLGLHGTIIGITLLPASVITGYLMSRHGNTVPFLYGAAMALVSACILAFGLRKADSPSAHRL